MRYTWRGRQPRVSEISKKLKIAQKLKQTILRGFLRHNIIVPTYFLFSLRQGIVGDHARRAELSEVLKK